MSKESIEEYKRNRIYIIAKDLTEILNDKMFFNLDNIDDEDIRDAVRSIMHMVNL
tara:strand:- start:31 stop:195 length:165 start_codon:yes stop_codon:yes gene_type:complete